MNLIYNDWYIKTPGGREYFTTKTIEEYFDFFEYDLSRFLTSQSKIFKYIKIESFEPNAKNKLKRIKISVLKNYKWNGANKPAIHTQNTVLPALFHDVCYQLIKEKIVSKKYRKYFDEKFYLMLRKNGMNYFRAKSYYYSVRSCGWMYC